MILEVSAIRGDKATQKKGLKELTRYIAEKLSALERSAAEKRHTVYAVAVKENLTEQVKQLSAFVT